MARPPAYDEPDPRERALGRRRLVAAVLTVLTLTAVAGGSAAAAVAVAHEDRADGHSTALVVRDDA
jgi:hypothetical protein